MIVQYIQSVEAQEIANRIHYTNMQNQYAQFVWNGDPNNVPENKATPSRIQEIWGADKLFLDCTEQETISQYSLVGVQYGVPLVKPLQGVTTSYDSPKDVYQLDAEGNILDTYSDCIDYPVDFDDYDLSGFDYNIIEIVFT